MNDNLELIHTFETVSTIKKYHYEFGACEVPKSKISIDTRFGKDKETLVYDEHSSTIRIDAEEENAPHPLKLFLLQLFDSTF